MHVFSITFPADETNHEQREDVNKIKTAKKNKNCKRKQTSLHIDRVSKFVYKSQASTGVLFIRRSFSLLN